LPGAAYRPDFVCEDLAELGRMLEAERG